MLKKIPALALALLVVVASAATVLAIKYGELDGNAHPYVGLMVAQDAKGAPLWRCSGTLISPTLFLTAGHCTEAPADRVEIWFQADVQSGVPDNGYPYKGQAAGTPFTHPDFDFPRADVGVVVLQHPYKLKKYGVLPTQDQLDALKVGILAEHDTAEARLPPMRLNDREIDALLSYLDSIETAENPAPR